ncbi:hypothetical protein [Couchioplanes azureus]|uniref:hypothetical protein n=1 Tax=Couchioplanes caeruleus TaxID=56438 RepID=UPI0016707291|nr:hypothetical protein [Couchioplanes caeruleus]GGQ86737.1 hypothetical protein GCM10010166_66100 [Couchioplanes caeruleus subsp. azureus]
MTTHTLVRDHTVTGTATQLANVVANHRTAGTLVALTAPRPVTGDRFQIIIRLREPAPARPTVRATSTSKRARFAVIVTALTGTIAGLLATAAYLLGQLVEFVTAHAGPVLAVLAIVAVLGALGARRTSGRRHCPGC